MVYRVNARCSAVPEIQTVNLDYSLLYKLQVKVLSPSASKQLAKFICSLPCLTILEIKDDKYLPDDFFTELASLAASSQIQTVKLDFNWIEVISAVLSHSASKQLAKFLCSLPHLKALAIIGNTYLHDDFFTELESLAASLQIQTVNLDFSGIHDLPVQSQSAFKQLAKFICSLPCLTTLEIKHNECLPDDFFTELESLAASSQNPYFGEKQHISMLQEWSVRKQQQQQQRWLEQQRQQQLWLEQRQQQQQRWLERQQQQQQWWSVRKHQQQQLNQCERPMPSTHQQPYLPHHVPLLESAPSSGQFQSYPHQGIQSEPEQINQSTTYQQLSPIMPLQSTFAPDQLTKQHLEELSSQETQQHSPHHGPREATQDTAVSQRQEDATPIETDDTSLTSSSVYINDLTSVFQGGLSIGMKPIDENDDNLAMPSTSGLSSAQSRPDAAPVEIERIPEHRKRIHSDEGDDDDGDRVDESQEQCPRKRRAKTDRQPSSP